MNFEVLSLIDVIGNADKVNVPCLDCMWLSMCNDNPKTTTKYFKLLPLFSEDLWLPPTDRQTHTHSII